MKKSRGGKVNSAATANQRIPAAAASDEASGAAKQQWKFKIVVLGNSGVGKTWLVERVLVHQPARSSAGRHAGPHAAPAAAAAAAFNGTIGVTFNLSRVQLADGRAALLQLWDTSGKDRYRNLVLNYMTRVHCVVIAYEPAEGTEASRRTLARWYAFAKEAAAAAGNGNGGEQPSQPIWYVIVALSGRRDLDQSAPPAACAADHRASVNFGRVFASSLCGGFFHQRVGAGGGGGDACALTPQWLAEQLLKRLDAMSDTRQLVLQQQQKLLHKKQQQQHPGPDDPGCFWCHRLLCCRTVKCSGVSGLAWPGQ